MATSAATRAARREHRVSNPAFAQAMREIGRSNATTPVPSGRAYNRAKARRAARREAW